jgi:hypothetical protein
VTSLEKGLIILELMSDQSRNISLTEISEKLGLGKGTVHDFPVTALRQVRYYFHTLAMKISSEFTDGKMRLKSIPSTRFLP